jgi:UDP-N-acetylglucosamine 2-epimerase
VPENLDSILSAFTEILEPIVFPVHPRTQKRIAELNGKMRELPNLKMIEPLGYLDMLQLEQNARLILTDSGGIQKEAYFFRVPCVTLRPETEWVETVEAGWNVIGGSSSHRILDAIQSLRNINRSDNMFFGDGYASVRIRENLESSRS